jgi:hypothetical protein
MSRPILEAEFLGQDGILLDYGNSDFSLVGMQIMVDDQERQPQTPRTPQSSVGGLRMRYFFCLPEY